MTKLKELLILQGAIDALGNDSYLGPALEKFYEYAESQMRSDFEPNIVGEYRRLVEETHAKKEELKKLHEELDVIKRNMRDTNITYENASERLRVVRDEVKSLYAAIK